MDYRERREQAIQELKQYKALAQSPDEQDRKKAGDIIAAVKSTTEQEQYFLEQFYINDQDHRRNGHVARAMAKYRLNRSNLLEVKNEALINYCFARIIASAKA